MGSWVDYEMSREGNKVCLRRVEERRGREVSEKLLSVTQYSKHDLNGKPRFTRPVYMLINAVGRKRLKMAIEEDRFDRVLSEPNGKVRVMEGGKPMAIEGGITEGTENNGVDEFIEAEETDGVSDAEELEVEVAGSSEVEDQGGSVEDPDREVEELEGEEVPTVEESSAEPPEDDTEEELQEVEENSEDQSSEKEELSGVELADILEVIRGLQTREVDLENRVRDVRYNSDGIRDDVLEYLEDSGRALEDVASLLEDILETKNRNEELERGIEETLLEVKSESRRVVRHMPAEDATQPVGSK